MPAFDLPSPPRDVPLLPWAAATELTLPGSKSDANRLLLLAAVTGSTVPIHGLPASDDVHRLLDGLRTLGFPVDLDAERAMVTVRPRPPAAPTAGVLECGNAGTALRFLVSLAAITPGEWTVTGDLAMQRRPIGPLVAAWRQLGVDASDTAGCPPVHVRGRSDVDGGIVQLDASVSSQFVSSLLLVGARLRRGITIEFPGAVASFDYAVWTCRTLARFGVGATLTPTGAAVPPGCRFVAPTQPIVVDGDWSSMGVWTCLAHLNGSRLVATNLRPDSGQADEGLARVLAEWPATGEHTIDVAPLPDQFLVLAVVAAFWPGTTRFVGGANLRHKECDRLAVMARELRRIGGDVDELPDGLVVRGGRPLRGATIDPAADHRVAMALALAGLLVGGMRIALPDCVAKSYPSFWRDLAQVAASRLPVVVVGMRGVGKSTFARAFAATAAAECIDVDAEFVGRHGPIAEFVAAHGWPRFRAEEERLLAAALRPGCVVATGGGAIESEATRRLLRDRALVVWLAADATLVRQRLSAAATDAAPRPSVTGRGLLDEVPTLLARRDPLYAEVATVRLDAALPTATLCAMAQERLARRTVAAG